MSTDSSISGVPTPRARTVLFLVPHLETGGAERQLTELVTRMDAKRFRPVVVCQKGGGPFFDEIQRSGVEIHRLDLHGRYDLRFALRLAQICRSRRVKAMVIQGFSTGVVGRLVGKLLGIRPILLAEHATGRIDPDPKKRPIERLLAPLADGIIAVAKGQIPFLLEDKGYPESKIRVIYNGIDLDAWQPLPRDQELAASWGIDAETPVIGILAMLRPEKDHVTFLRAARLVADLLPRAKFLIVGDGVERPSLEQLTKELGLSGCVTFTGRRADIPNIVSLFDVTVLTSTTVETFPMSFLEAMALGKPLVTTRVGGVPEMIDEGVNGFVVPMRDPEKLAEALVAVVKDRSRAESMGRASRRIVGERFTMEKMVRETEDYLEEFLGREE